MSWETRKRKKQDRLARKLERCTIYHPGGHRQLPQLPVISQWHCIMCVILILPGFPSILLQSYKTNLEWKSLCTRPDGV